MGREILAAYKDIAFECFVDNKVKNGIERCEGLPVIPFCKYLDRYRDAIVIISSRLYYESIYRQLKENGISENNIVNAGKMIDDMSKRQYFDMPELKRNSGGKQESFVDAGCFDGRTSILFAEWCQGSYNHIWAFEPDGKSAEICRNELRKYVERYEVIPKGLWDEETELNFVAGSSGGSRISESGSEKYMYVSWMKLWMIG